MEKDNLSNRILMINVKEIRGVENHHKNTAVIIAVGKIHW